MDPAGRSNPTYPAPNLPVNRVFLLTHLVHINYNHSVIIINPYYTPNYCLQRKISCPGMPGYCTEAPEVHLEVGRNTSEEVNISGNDLLMSLTLPDRKKKSFVIVVFDLISVLLNF